MTSKEKLASIDTGSFHAAAEAPAAIQLSPLGRRLRLAFLFLSLVSVALVHMPWLPVELQTFGHAYTNLTGQDVRWTMFSSDPRGTSLDLWAEITYADGTHSTWAIDRTGGGGDFGFYRMLTWMEVAVLRPRPGSLEHFADYLIESSPRPVSRIEIWTSQRQGQPPDEARPPTRADLVLAVEPRGSSSG